MQLDTGATSLLAVISPKARNYNSIAIGNHTDKIYN